MNMTNVAPSSRRAESEFELVHADLLRFFPDLVCELGGNPEALMRRLDMDPRLVLSAEPTLTYRSWIMLLELAAAELRCLDFGMRLARRQGGGRVFGAMGVVMKNSNTFGQAIEYVIRHVHAHSLAAEIRLETDRLDRRQFVAHEILLDGLPNRRQAIEQALLLGHLNAVEITGGQARVREVHFRHQPLSPRRTYRAYFGTTVCFDAKSDGLAFDAQDLQAPIVAPNPQLYAATTSSIDARFTGIVPPLHAQVRALVVRSIETGDCGIQRICADLGMHPRTLHRRLRVEGKSFEGIKDEVRRDVALRYLLESNHPLSFIAAKLGYAEQSVLTRSCLRWFATVPSELRSRAFH